MRIQLLACQTVKDELERWAAGDMKSEFLPFGLHRTPERLLCELRERLRSEEADTVVLGYGLCCNAVVGLAPRRGQRLVIPRVHDCISLLMGSRKAYHAEFMRCPGTIYLSKGWIDSQADPLSAFNQYREKHGDEIAKWVIEEEHKNYTRVCLIDTGVGDLSKYRTYSWDVASFLKMSFEELKGSDMYFGKMLDPSGWDQDFVIIEYPGEIRQSMFL